MKKVILLALLVLVPSLSQAKIVGRSIANDYCANIVTVVAAPTNGGATTNFIDLSAGGTAATEVLADRYIVPVETFASNLRVTLDTSPGTGNDYWTATIIDDTVDTSITCQITGSDTSCTDATNIAEIAGGSKVTVSLVGTGNGITNDPDAVGEAIISFCTK